MRKYDALKGRVLVFKVTEADATNLLSVADKLDISLSELLRRSVRLGSRVLEDCSFPGASKPERINKTKERRF